MCLSCQPPSGRMDSDDSAGSGTYKPHPPSGRRLFRRYRLISIFCSRVSDCPVTCRAMMSPGRRKRGPTHQYEVACAGLVAANALVSARRAPASIPHIPRHGSCLHTGYYGILLLAFMTPHV